MTDTNWKDRLGKVGFATEPSLFQKSRDKRLKMEEELKMFANTNTFKNSSPRFKSNNVQVPKINIPNIPKSPQPYSFAQIQKPESSQKIVIEQKPRQQQQINYSMSLKLSQSGLGNKSKRQLENINLSNEFYQLKESRMLSDDQDNKKQFPFVLNEEQRDTLNHQHTDLELIKQVVVNTQLEKHQTIKQSLNIDLQKQQKQQNKEPLRQTIKQLTEQVNHQDRNSETIKPIYNQIISNYEQQHEKQHQDIKEPEISEVKQLQVFQQSSNDHHGTTPQNLSNSSGKFFYTSQFKQYMQNKSNYQEAQLNETIKSTILDKVFNEDIKEPQFIQYLDLDKIKGKNAANQLSDLFELAYEKEIIIFLNDLKDILRILPKYKTFIKKTSLRKLNRCFLHIKLYQEYKQWKKQIKAKAEEFARQKDLRLLENCFIEWKRESFDEIKQQKLQIYKSVKEQAIKQTIFKNWKLLLFYNKIQKIAINFRIGTLFRGWNRVAKESAKENNRKAIKFYYFNLMRRVFDGWYEGIMNMREENDKKYLALNFNRNRLIKTVFKAFIKLMEQKEENDQNNYVNVEVVIEHSQRKK